MITNKIVKGWRWVTGQAPLCDRQCTQHIGSVFHIGIGYKQRGVFVSYMEADKRGVNLVWVSSEGRADT